MTSSSAFHFQHVCPFHPSLMCLPGYRESTRIGIRSVHTCSRVVCWPIPACISQHGERGQGAETNGSHPMFMFSFSIYSWVIIVEGRVGMSKLSRRKQLKPQHLLSKFFFSIFHFPSSERTWAWTAQHLHACSPIRVRAWRVQDLRHILDIISS